jgi:restriction system protein
MPRRARKSDSGFIGPILPWWVLLILAAVTFAGFHLLAGMDAKATTPAGIIAKSLWIGLGMAGQVLFPLVFIVAACRSLIHTLQRRYRFQYPLTISPGIPYENEPTQEVRDHDFYGMWKDVTTAEPARSSIDTTRWSKGLLDALEWKRFEVVCGRYFETIGFTSKVAREGADGGVDIHLYAAGSDTPGILVQCKAWKAYPVGIKPIRELLGVMTASRVAEGIFISTGEYTSEARRFAAQNNIHLIDGSDLLAKIQAVPADHQRSLLEVATAGDFTTPTCPSCGLKMVNRIAQKSGDQFWGCTGYPRCRRTFHQAQS